MDLRSFWRDMPLHVILYEVRDGVKVHTDAAKHHVFNWRIANNADAPGSIFFADDAGNGDLENEVEETEQGGMPATGRLSRPEEAEGSMARRLQQPAHDRPHVPVWIEACKGSKKRHVLYLVCWPSIEKAKFCSAAELCSFVPNAIPVSSFIDVSHEKEAFKIDSQCHMLDNALQPVEGPSTTAEDLKRMLAGFKALLSAGGSSTQGALMTGGARDIGVHPRSKEVPIREGMVLHALWCTHWIQAWLRLYPGRCSLYRTHSSKPYCKIISTEVLSASEAPPQFSPLGPSFALMRVATAGKVFALACSSEEERDAWLRAMKGALVPVRGAAFDASSERGLVSDARELYLGRSVRWGPHNYNKAVLNNRCILLGRLTDAAGPSPCRLSAKLLRAAIALGEWADRSKVVDFLDMTVELQAVELDGLSEEAAICFWLNTFHALLIHALNVVGAPHSAQSWPHFFKHVCYEINGAILSLAEIEHCIIRAPLSQPRHWLAHFTLPKWSPSDGRSKFALRKAEPLVNFVMNCGSFSYPSRIVVFNGDLPAGGLRHQLAAASVAFLEHTVSLCAEKSKLSLPKVCDWYASDLGGSAVELVKTLLDTTPLGAAIPSADNKKLKVEYSPVDYNCRHMFEELQTKWSALPCPADPSQINTTQSRLL